MTDDQLSGLIWSGLIWSGYEVIKKKNRLTDRTSNLVYAFGEEKSLIVTATTYPLHFQPDRIWTNL